MTSLTKKTAPPNQKNFFRVHTTRLATSFDTSTWSVTHTGARDEQGPIFQTPTPLLLLVLRLLLLLRLRKILKHQLRLLLTL